MKTKEVFGVSILLSLSIMLMMILSGCECCKKKEPCPPKKAACPTSKCPAKGQMTYADSGTTVAKKDIIETATDARKFRTLIKALDAAELTKILKEKGPFTVFAPNDKAFGKLAVGTLDDLLKPENKARLQRILKYHVISGKIMAIDITGKKSFKTLEGQPIRLVMKDKILWADNGRVLTANMHATNGVIHVIDTVLMPPETKK